MLKPSPFPRLELRADTGSWAVLDERRDLCFGQRHQRMLLQLGSAGSGSGNGSSTSDAQPGALPSAAAAAPLASRRFRLRVVSVADPAAANSVQLACLDLYGQPEEQQQRQQQEEQQQRQQQEEGQLQQQQPATEAAAAVPPTAELAALAMQGTGDGQEGGSRQQDSNPWAQLFASQ